MLQRMADPQMVVQAQKDPEFYKVGVSNPGDLWMYLVTPLIIPVCRELVISGDEALQMCVTCGLIPMRCPLVPMVGLVGPVRPSSNAGLGPS
jgi:hypothetical protein